MRCARCEALAAELAAARKTIAAWESYDDGQAQTENSLERLARWQARFKLTMSEALVLLALVDRSGRPVSIDALLKVVQSRPGADRAREVEGNLVQVLIHRIRKILDRDGLGDAIQTMRSVGYLTPPLAVLALKSRVGEA